MYSPIALHPLMLFVLRLVLHVMVHLGLRSGSFSSNSEVVLEMLVFISEIFGGMKLANKSNGLPELKFYDREI